MDAKLKGRFITLEGVEGSGKTTQARKLAACLRRRGLKVVLTEEPGGTVIGNRLRSLLLDRRHKMDSLAELLLFQSIRAQHVSEVILPALRRGDTVVCSRFCDATLAYQGFGRGLNRDLIELLNHIAARGLVPDLTVLLDVPVRRGLVRARGAVKAQSARGELDRIESEKAAFHNRIRRGYLALASKAPRRFAVLDGTLPVGELHEKIRAVLEKKWASNRSSATGKPSRC